MKLSVIIVNYNVKFFLDQCLQSVIAALKNIQGEIFVVDNNSVDGSAGMIKEKFPAVKLIVNEENLGFSVANNIAIKQAAGEYILLLNPDTVVEEDTFDKTIAYLDAHLQAGALGVKMIDGKGNFLPESKRGLPTPWVAFYKVFGISKIFPKSKIFGQYHLSFLDADTIHQIDVLCGAFMMMRKKVLNETGLLDESFFMYGEDIDLSYRIQKAGHQIIYFPQTTIIHYKGESTKKSSLNYVYLFYGAMQIFAKKHLTGKGAVWLNIFINTAIYARASLSVIKRGLLHLLLPVLDTILICIGIVALTNFWETFWFKQSDYYPHSFFSTLIPAYIAIWIVSLFFAGAYDYPIRLKNSITGILGGMILILIMYALLPQHLRFSRVIILLGTVVAGLLTLVVRYLLSFSGWKQFILETSLRKRILIAGSLQECERVRAILEKLHVKFEFLAFVSPSKELSAHFSGTISQMKEMVQIHKINEIIFCPGDIPASVIINQMLLLSDSTCAFKTAPANSGSIIGSNSIDTTSDLFVFNMNSVASAKNRRLKRTFDIIVSIVLLLLTPIWIWNKKNIKDWLKDIFHVITNQNSWIGYSDDTNKTYAPKLKKGIFAIDQAYPESRNNLDLKERLNIVYARNYKLTNDIRIFLKAFSHAKQQKI